MICNKHQQQNSKDLTDDQGTHLRDVMNQTADQTKEQKKRKRRREGRNEGYLETPLLAPFTSLG